MDDEAHAPLEESLKALRPSEVPAELEAKVFAMFDDAPGTSSLVPIPAFPAEEAGQEPDNVVTFPIWRRIGTAAAVLVAGVGVFFAALNSFGPRPDGGGGATVATDVPLHGSPTGGTFRPVSAENVFEGVRDGGVFIGEAGAPVRELRYDFSHQFRWEDPVDGAVFEMTVPRQRSFLVPVRTD